MKTNIVLSLDKRRQKKDGSMQIVYRLGHNRRTVIIPSGYHVTENGWDSNNRKIKTSYKAIDNVVRVNNLLEKTKAKYLDKIVKLDDKGELNNLSVSELKEKILSKTEQKYVFPFMEEMIQEFNDQKRIGNAKAYRSTLVDLQKFRNDKDFTFSEFNYQFLLKYESYYLKKGNSLNGLAVHMRTIRAVYNKAAKLGYASRDNYPFDHYTIKTKPTKKRAISMEAIQKIIALDYEVGEPRFKARNVFLMSFYMMGAPYIDLAFLKVENIVDGRVQYKRRKTGKFYDIKITDNLKPIIDYYAQGKEKSEFLLPIIKREVLAEQYLDIATSRRYYNRLLERIAKDAKIDEHLTSYVSRHSFASIANNMAIPVTAISEMLGHQKLTTTQTYLASLNKEIIDDYNAQIIGF